MTPEQKVKDKIRKRFKREWPDAFRCMPMGTGFGKNGDPDFIFCIRGLFVGIEAKAGRKAEVTALQQVRLNQIAKSGGVAIVVRCQESLDDAVKQIHRVLVAGGAE